MRISRNAEAWIVSIAIATIIIIILASCGSGYHLKRARHHLAKAEELGAEYYSDTLVKVIEIPIPEVHKDTVFKSSVGDTVVIHKDRLKVVYIKLPGDSVFLDGECKADTILKPMITKITRTIYTPSNDELPFWAKILIGGLLLACVALIFKR